MRKCPDCGFEFDDEKSFCPSCGKYMPRIKNPYPSGEDKTEEEQSAPFAEAPEQGFSSDTAEKAAEEKADLFEEAPAFSAEEPVKTPSTWSFVLSLFLLSLPVIGLIYAVVLAFGGTKYPAKKYLARAIFLYGFIALVLTSAAVLVMMFIMGEEAFILFVNNLIGINPLM